MSAYNNNKSVVLMLHLNVGGMFLARDG